MNNRQQRRHPVGQQQAVVNIKVEDLPLLHCTCGNNILVQMFQVRYLSPLMAPDGKEQLIQFLTGWSCPDCGVYYNQEQVLTALRDIRKPVTPEDFMKKEGDENPN